MDPVSIGLGVASLATGLFGASAAKKKAKEAAREQSELTYQQRKAEMRQNALDNSFDESTGRAALYASNLQRSGSSNQYLQSMDLENMRSEAWARRAAETERRAIRKGASGAGDALLYSTIGNAAGHFIRGAMTPSPTPAKTEAG